MSRRLRLDTAPPPVLVEGDARVHALQAAAAEPRRAEDYVAEIARLWNRAQGTFIDIGRLLIRAKEALPHGEYTAAVEANLPFSARTAYQLREAARWTMGGAVPPERLPGSYSTIYLLSTLEPATLREAERDGLIRPELRRAELVEWRRRRGSGPSTDQPHVRLERLRREREKIEQEILRIEAELAAQDAAAR